MYKVSIPALVVLLATLCGPCCCCFGATKMKYEDLEERILSKYNIEKIKDTFFPTNDHSKKIVQVSYQVLVTEKPNNSSQQTFQEGEVDEVDKGINFHWLSSSVHLCINADMLYGLSLRTYNPEIASVSLDIDLSGVCSTSEITYELDTIEKLRNDGDTRTLCNGSIYLLKILNDFTANLLMYALGQTSHLKGIIHPENRGYSVYYYQPNSSSSYCVIQKEDAYDKQRFYLNSGSVLIFICTIFGFPLLFFEVYKLAWRKLNHKSGSEYWRFITWSVVIVSLSANVLILVNNSFVLDSLYSEYNSTFTDIFVFLTIFILFCFGGWIINFFSCVAIIAYMDKKKVFSKDFPLPTLLDETIKCFSCFSCHSTKHNSPPTSISPVAPSRSEKNRKCCPQCIILALGYAIFVHFLQLISFHILYVILGAVASPAETLSVFFDYITAYLFSVICVAVILKYMNKLYFEKVSLNFLACILPLSIAGLSLITAVACFTIYFYRYTEMMETNNQNEGLWGVVKTILPSIIVLFLGYCGHKLLRYIKRSSKNSSSDNSSEAKSSTNDSLSTSHSSSDSVETLDLDDLSQSSDTHSALHYSVSSSNLGHNNNHQGSVPKGVQVTAVTLEKGYSSTPCRSSLSIGTNAVPTFSSSSLPQATGSSHSSLTVRSQHDLGEKQPLLPKTE